MYVLLQLPFSISPEVLFTSGKSYCDTNTATRLHIVTVICLGLGIWSLIYYSIELFLFPGLWCLFPAFFLFYFLSSILVGNLFNASNSNTQSSLLQAKGKEVGKANIRRKTTLSLTGHCGNHKSQARPAAMQNQSCTSKKPCWSYKSHQIGWIHVEFESHAPWASIIRIQNRPISIVTAHHSSENQL